MRLVNRDDIIKKLPAAFSGSVDQYHEVQFDAACCKALVLRCQNFGMPPQ